MTEDHRIVYVYLDKYVPILPMSNSKATAVLLSLFKTCFSECSSLLYQAWISSNFESALDINRVSRFLTSHYDLLG